MKTTNKSAQHEHHKKDNSHSGDSGASKGQQWTAGPGKSYVIFSVVIMVVLLGVIIYLVAKPSGSGPDPVKPSDFKGDKVKVEFYVMSQCPYGTQVEDAIAPVLKKMGDAVDFQLNYIVKETSPGVFQALHGEPEVKGNIVQLCVNSYYPDKLIDFVVCQNKDAKNVATNWESCANGLGLDAAKIGKCFNSDEGKNLLRTSMNLAQARGATGSPTIYINDVSYNGGRESTDFQRAICQYSDHPECANIPACAADTDCVAQPGKEGFCVNPGAKEARCDYKDPVPVEMIVLNDDKCTTCDTTRIVQATQQLFLGVKPRLVDIDTEEGKALVQKYSVAVVPAFVFEPSVTQTATWNAGGGQIQAYFDALSDGKYKLKDEATGATYFVSEDARKAYEAEQEKLNAEKLTALNVVKGDNKPQIDFFVMSYCPFGNQAEEGIAPVYNLLKDKAVFRPRYVIYSNYGGGGPNYCLPGDEICSMHGIQELNQNIREACVYKYDGTQAWFDFALAMNKKCTSQNADTCWEAVAKDLKLDTARIKTCEKNEGEALMKADLDAGNKLGVQGSPSVFVEGIEYTGGRAPESYKTSLCAAFTTQPSECATQLAGEANANAPAAGSC